MSARSYFQKRDRLLEAARADEARTPEDLASSVGMDLPLALHALSDAGLLEGRPRQGGEPDREAAGAEPEDRPAKGLPGGEAARAIVEVLRERGARLSSELIHDTGLSKSRVYETVTLLTQAGLVSRGEARRPEYGSGRASRVVRLAGDPELLGFVDPDRARHHRMASGADRIGDAEGARRRHRSGRASKRRDDLRAGDERRRLRAVLEEVGVQTHPSKLPGGAGEGLVIARIRALGDAKKRGAWADVQRELIGLAAASAAWAAKVSVAEGDAPGDEVPAPEPVEPPAGELVPAGGGENGADPSGDPAGAGHPLVARVAARYADVLLDRAGDDLSGREARDTIERMLGVPPRKVGGLEDLA